ncbi:MAG: ECF transporter S component [Candidatus Ranarchaeia archaeon]
MTEIANEKYPVSLAVALAGIFTALTTASTIVISVYIPATTGYFNMGEALVFISAILFGPYIGAFSGGVGSMLADMILAPVFMPATLIGKGLEGFIVGWVYHRLRNLDRLRDRRLTVVLAILVSTSLTFLGVTFYVGSAELLGMTFEILGAFWVISACLLILTFAVLIKYLDSKINTKIFAVLIGSIPMITGYLLYETFILGYPGIVEVPFNVLQVLVGLAIAVPVTDLLENSLSLFPNTKLNTK